MNSDKLNHLIRIKAHKYKLDVELIYRNFMFERFLERLSQSKYKEHFIVKGGYLIGSMIGVENRVTKDLDATLRYIEVDKMKLVEVFQEIASINLDDNIRFEFKSILEIREKFDYLGYRISFDALFQKTKIHLKMDVTVGDSIVPDAINYYHQCMFEDKLILIKSYALETILAEKLETIITWGISGSRLRDYYDVHILMCLFGDRLDLNLLYTSLIATASKRRTIEQVKNHNEVLKMISNDKSLQLNWLRYQDTYEYSKDINFMDVVQTIKKVLAELNISK